MAPSSHEPVHHQDHLPFIVIPWLWHGPGEKLVDAKATRRRRGDVCTTAAVSFYSEFFW